MRATARRAAGPPAAARRYARRFRLERWAPVVVAAVAAVGATAG
jgi:hypothetical protein